jgi:hypothetical protein
MATAESMSLRDMVFWLFVVLFGTGTEVIYRSQGEGGEIAGITLIVVGLAGMVGCAWPLLKDPLTGKFQLTWGLAQRLWRAPLYRTAVSRLILTYVVIYAAVYVHTLRTDINMYAMPRTVTKEQADALRHYLSQHREKYSVTVRTTAHSQEADEYAGRIFNALNRTGWDSHLDESDDSPEHPNPIPSLIGMCVFIRGANGGSDQETTLRQAFVAAGIPDSGCGPGRNGEYTLFVLVGHRPLVVGDNEPLAYKIGRWFNLHVFGPWERWSTE